MSCSLVSPSSAHILLSTKDFILTRPLGVEKKVYGPSGYAVYLKKRFADYAKELGTNKVCEVMKVLSKVWKDLSDEERRPYMDEAAAIRAAKRAEGELLRTMLKRKQR